ncbi:MAG: hypothetical protein K940chlam3_00712 [Chlamydiae bacterium]|nr:hypothetical protein [Chlamydiota bacterium]
MTLLKKRIIGIIAVFAMLFTYTGSLGAEDYTYCGGRGYSEYRTCPNLAPGIALGAIALAAIIAVAVQNSNNEHGHCHL